MTAYILTRHRDLPGVRLSKAGHWGNIPFDDEEAALAEVARIAGEGAEVVRETFGCLA